MSDYTKLSISLSIRLTTCFKPHAPNHHTFFLFWLSFRSLPRRYYWKIYNNGCHCTKSVKPSLLLVSLPEAFELTRFIETSNEDPTPYVNILRHIVLLLNRYNMDLYYYIPMSIYRCMVMDESEVFEVSGSPKPSANKRFYHYVSPLPSVAF